MKKKVMATLMATVLSLSVCTACGQTNEAVSTLEAEQEVSAEEIQEQADVGEEVLEEKEEPVQEESVQETESTEEAVQDEVAEQEMPDMSGYEYQLVFAIDGTEKPVGFHTPEGYACIGKSPNYYQFSSPANDLIYLSPFTEEDTGEEALEAYRTYLETGAWTGLYPSFMDNVLEKEESMELSCGKAMVLTTSSHDVFITQDCFVEIDGAMVHVSRNLDLPLELTEDGEERDAALDERISDTQSVLEAIFTSGQSQEHVYEIPSGVVDFSQDNYDYKLTTFSSDMTVAEPIFGFDFPYGEYTKTSEGLDFDGVVIESDYEFTDANGNKVSVDEVMNLSDGFGNVGYCSYFMRTGQCPEGVDDMYIEDGNFAAAESGMLVDMKYGAEVETAYGKAHVVYSLWKYQTFSKIRENVIVDINDSWYILDYTNAKLPVDASLDGYQGKFEEMIPVMLGE